MRHPPVEMLLLLLQCIVSFSDRFVAAYQTTPVKPTLSSPTKSTSSIFTGNNNIDVLDNFEERDTSSLYLDAVRRASEIGVIIGGEVVAPILLSSLSSAFRPRTTEVDSDDGGWDTFWSTTTPGSLSSKHTAISHATRLANALELLGPTYVKFGQALGSRPDVVPPSLAVALSTLQDDMAPFSSAEAREIITRELMALHHHDEKLSSLPSEEDINALVLSLSDLPVAAASIGQVYEAHLPIHSGQPPIRVAVKVQRPGVRKIVDQDTKMLLAIAELLDSIPPFSFLPSSSSSTTSVSTSKSTQRLINTHLAPAVREFMSRILEELDYRNEANNIVTFADLYSEGGGRSINKPSSKRKKNTTIPRVIVPEVYLDWCTENVLVMEWIDGTKLTNVRQKTRTDAAGVFDGDDNARRYTDDGVDNNNKDDDEDDDSTRKENLALVKVAIDCTLHQLLVTGTLHADPHAGNLLKILHQEDDNNSAEVSLGYLDFGLLSTIPERVRDALVCAVALQVFERDAYAVASLFGELHLIPQHVLDDVNERAALAEALSFTFENALLYSSINDISSGEVSVGGSRRNDDTTITAIPELKFDKLLDSLSRLVPRFQFDLPPYFINNARALSTLEGIAKSLDPTFNVLTVMYPYALNRLLRNPTRSPVVDRTVQTLIRSPSKDGSMIIDRQKIRRLLKDSASITGQSQERLVWDVMKTRPGRKLTRGILIEELRRMYSSMRKRADGGKRKEKRRNKWYYFKL